MEKLPPESSGQTLPAVAAPSTTYVHADANTFREVVQRLTGPIELRLPSPPAKPARGGAAAAALRSPSPPFRAAVAPPPPKVAGVKRPPLGLQDRRQCPPRPALVIPKPGVQSFSAPTSPGVASPSPPTRSPLTSPSTNMASLSLFEREEITSAVAELNEEEEERAIKEKRFYMHPSPRSGQRKVAEPELLPLFPTTTPAESP